MKTVRLSITIPADVAMQLHKLVGPKKKSQFITETLREKLDNIQRKRLQKVLAEGYKASGRESLELVQDFEFVDLEG